MWVAVCEFVFFESIFIVVIFNYVLLPVTVCTYLFSSLFVDPIENEMMHLKGHTTNKVINCTKKKVSTTKVQSGCYCFSHIGGKTYNITRLEIPISSSV